MKLRLRNPGVLALVFISLTLSTLSSGQEARRVDFDRRSTMRLRAAPNQEQLDALAALREELDGSLVESIDEASGATRSLFNPVGKLTPPNPGDPVDIAIGYVRDHVSLLGLVDSDLAELQVCDVVHSAVTGATHVYMCQRHQGVDVFNAQLHVNVSSDGSILSVNNSFVPEIGRAGKTVVASIVAEDACVAAANHLGVPSVRARRQGRRVVAEELSTEPIDPELIWIPVGRSVRLAWRFEVHTTDGKHIYDMTVDAEPGRGRRSRNRVMTRFDRVSPGLYEVYPVPVESPSHAPVPDPEDGRTMVVAPEDPTASPLGWHDDGTQSYQIMRGNNVHAYDDLDANDAPPAVEPDCGPNLECSFPLDLTTDPYNYTAASVANLFYWTNIIHDVQYLYGFDEAAGNFQFDNFGLGGLGGDRVRAEAQDGSGIDNANFTTAVDGSPPKIQMFLWDLTYPLRDGDLDSGIIVHEYGHGISTRLVGGPSTVSCLSNFQQPGEGLSDWWSLVYTARPGDSGRDARGIGNYVVGAPPGPLGIRTQAYSTDPSVNTHTYESIAGMAVPHGVGEVWAQAAWEAYWMLVNVYGFDPNLYDPMGGSGNQRMMLYVNEGLKNTACSPTFTDVRDGIIQAAIDNYDGGDVCLLWEAFANFGLGADAISGGAWSTTPTNGFQIPASCLAGPRITNPPSLSVLDGSTVTFEWTADGEAVDEWVVDIGTSIGEDDIYSSDSLLATTLSDTVSVLPVDGSQLFVRLNYRIGSEWSFRDAFYTADLATPEITSPVPNTTLAGTTVTFFWDALGLPVDNWGLDIGSSFGNTNYYTSGTLDASITDVEAVGIPTDGRTVYVRLRYFFDGDWNSVDYTYSAADIVPTLVTPTPNATLTGSVVRFEWNGNGGLVEEWTLNVGSSVGYADIFQSGSLDATETSVDVPNIPTDGREIHARLQYSFSGAWASIDFVFTAADLAPQLTAPTAGSVLTSSSVTFEWATNGAAVQAWSLGAGSSAGYFNYFSSGTLADNVFSTVVSDLPTDSRTIHVQLRYQLNNVWHSLDYQYVAADLVPELTSPAAGSVLPGETVTFAWTSSGASVSNWTLMIGTRLGLGNIYYSGTLASTVSSMNVSGLPIDSSPLHVRLRYLSNGTWSTLDHVFTAAGPPAIITAPVPNSTLAGTTALFTWQDNGNNAAEWRLTIGSSLGGDDVHNSGALPAGARSHEATNLPINGQQLFVRLSYNVSGVISHADVVYTAVLLEPNMTSPEPSSVLTGSIATFEWSANTAAVTTWRLRVGATPAGDDYFDSGPLGPTELARTVSGLPTDSSNVYARLEYTIDGATESKDYVYISGLPVPELVTPTPDSVLAGSEALFSWTANERPVGTWIFSVGTSQGGSNLYYSGYIQSGETSRNVTGIPTDSRTIHVRLRYLLDGTWKTLDYQYTAADITPELLTPEPNAILAGSSVDFTWTSNGSPVTSWIVRIGSSLGGSNYHYSGSLTSSTTSRHVTGLPTDSRTIYVRLSALLNGVWNHTDYQYTAADITPELTSPTAGTVLPGSDVTFQWMSNGAGVTRWILQAGTTVGGTNLHYSGSLASNVVSRMVTGLPTDSRTIYVRLRYVLNGRWQQSDYQFTAADLTPELLSPTPSTVLSGPDVTFQWTSNGAPVTLWILDVGTTAGSSNLHYSGTLASNVVSRLVTSLPTDGSTIHVRLRYVVNGAWKNTMYEYTAASP